MGNFEAWLEKRSGGTSKGKPELRNMKTWTDRLGQSGLRSFTDEEGHFWLEQNSKKSSKWAKLARQRHDVAWEFAGPGGEYTGRMLVDGEIYTASEATKKFFPKDDAPVSKQAGARKKRAMPS